MRPDVLGLDLEQLGQRFCQEGQLRDRGAKVWHDDTDADQPSAGERHAAPYEPAPIHPDEANVAPAIGALAVPRRGVTVGLDALRVQDRSDEHDVDGDARRLACR